MDQFAFCVALYEGFCGKRPFDGRDSRKHAHHNRGNGSAEAGPGSAPSAEDGCPRPVGRRPWIGIPRWTRSSTRSPAIRAGRSVARSGWRSQSRCSSWRCSGRGSPSHQAEPQCRGAALKLRGVWDLDRKQAIHAAFDATGRAFAADTWRSVEARLDHYARSWEEMFTDTCEATGVRGEQSDQVLTLRTQCLGQRLGDLGALSDLFAKADRTIVQNAVTAADVLGDLSMCSDLGVLASEVAPPGTRERAMRPTGYPQGAGRSQGAARHGQVRRSPEARRACRRGRAGGRPAGPGRGAQSPGRATG